MILFFLFSFSYSYTDAQIDGEFGLANYKKKHW